MVERTTVTQVVQLGVETTPGTGVAANKKTPSLSIDGAIKTNVDKYRPLGNKFNTIHAQGKEWVEAKISGEPTYSEIVYLLSSILAADTPAQQAATAAYLWEHRPSSTAEDTVKTFTVERGSALRADKFTYGIVNEFELKGDRENVELSGMMLGRALQDGITLTASPTDIEQIPMLPKEFDVYVDTTFGALGTTKLTRLLKWGLKLSSRFGPLWTVNSAEASWVTHVELPVEAELTLLVEADAAGMAFLPLVRDGSTRFVRIKATSGQFAGTAIPYSLSADLAVKAGEPKEFADEEGVYAIEFSFGLVHDAGWGKALAVDIINKQTAL